MKKIVKEHLYEYEDTVDKITGGKVTGNIDAEFDKNGEYFDYSKISNIEVDGIDYRDYPDFVDAYITAADYDGVPMTEDELDILEQEPYYDELVYKAVENVLY